MANELKYLPAIPGSDPTKVVLPCQREWHLYVQVRCDEAEERPQGNIDIGIARQRSQVGNGKAEDLKFKTQLGAEGTSPADLAMKGNQASRYYLWAQTADKEWLSEEDLEVELDVEKKICAEVVLGLALARRLRLRRPSLGQPPPSPPLPQAGHFRIPQSDFATYKIAAKNASLSAQQKPQSSSSFLKDDGSTNLVARTMETVDAIRISSDGKLAIEDGGDRQAKTFFLDPSLIAAANAQLKKARSAYLLVQEGGTLTVPDKEKKLHELVQVVAENQKDKSKGDGVTGPVNCDAMGGEVGGWVKDENKRLKLKGGSEPIWENEEGHRAAAYVAEYAARKDDFSGKRSGAAKASKYQPAKPPVEMVRSYVVKLKVRDVKAFKKLLSDQGLKGVDNAVGFTPGKESKESGEVVVGLNQTQYDAVAAENGNGNVSALQITAQNETPKQGGNLDLARALADQRDGIARAYATMDATKLAEVAERLGVNEFAAPRIGDAFVVFSTGAKRDGQGVLDHATGRRIDAKWGQHWGGVVASSSGEYVTLENYDRQSEDVRAPGAKNIVAETRAFFMMYGSAPGQTWHEIQKATGEFPNPISLVYANKDRAK